MDYEDHVEDRVVKWGIIGVLILGIVALFLAIAF